MEAASCFAQKLHTVLACRVLATAALLFPVCKAILMAADIQCWCHARLVGHRLHLQRSDIARQFRARPFAPLLVLAATY